ncbi:WhiB-family transcriptional regulator [Actinomycetales bacterium JB111]|nr:WhiB-family transcriptional regulator [Actinomycetales bacterium JB111]
MTAQLTAYAPAQPTTPAATGQIVGFPTTPLVDLPTAGADTPCRTSDDPDLWFAERTADVEAAKAACGPCPLREACLAGALERAEPWGVWGGQVFVEGEVVAVKRGRGRPRKCEAA